MLPYHSRIVSETHKSSSLFFVLSSLLNNDELKTRNFEPGFVNLVHNPKVRSFGNVLEPRYIFGAVSLDQ
jgi:hypothetical protein